MLASGVPRKFLQAHFRDHPAMFGQSRWRSSRHSVDALLARIDPITSLDTLEKAGLGPQSLRYTLSEAAFLRCCWNLIGF